jgi:hypothetical protein
MKLVLIVIHIVDLEILGLVLTLWASLLPVPSSILHLLQAITQILQGVRVLAIVIVFVVEVILPIPLLLPTIIPWILRPMISIINLIIPLLILYHILISVIITLWWSLSLSPF